MVSNEGLLRPVCIIGAASAHYGECLVSARFDPPDSFLAEPARRMRPHEQEKCRNSHAIGGGQQRTTAAAQRQRTAAAAATIANSRCEPLGGSAANSLAANRGVRSQFSLITSPFHSYRSGDKMVSVALGWQLLVVVLAVMGLVLQGCNDDISF